MTLCRECVLDDGFPGISFDDEGVCSFCREHKGEAETQALRLRFENKFNTLVEKIRGTEPYDCLLAYSGGKDSTFTLHLLKRKYGLRVLALSYDNWFQSERAAQNIKNVVRRLDVDHITVRPRFEVFRQIVKAVVDADVYSVKAMQRASSICTTCISLVRFACFKVAIEKEIPLVVFGMSPGQAPIVTSVVKTNPAMIRETQGAIVRPLQNLVGDAVLPYFLGERDFAKADRFPYSVNPLPFSNYDEETVSKMLLELGWTPPDDTDANSTNCLLNAFANDVHKARYGFHPYAFELASLVRDGYLDRATAVERLNRPEDPAMIELARQKLGLG